MKTPTFLLPVLLAAALLACSKKETTAASQATQAKAAPQQAQPLPLPPPAKYLRDHYATLADCVADWGFAGKCVPVPAGAPEKAQGVQFFGPTYSSALRGETQMAARKEAFEQGYVKQIDETPSDKSSGKSEVKA
jgi:hypothetical protein